jgi:hypothetical protein
MPNFGPLSPEQIKNINKFTMGIQMGKPPENFPPPPEKSKPVYYYYTNNNPQFGAGAVREN